MASAHASSKSSSTAYWKWKLQCGDFPGYSQACTDGHVTTWAEHKKGVAEEVISPLQGNDLFSVFWCITVKYAYLASSILTIYAVPVLFDIVLLKPVLHYNYVCAHKDTVTHVRICYKMVYWYPHHLKSVRDISAEKRQLLPMYLVSSYPQDLWILGSRSLLLGYEDLLAQC